MIISILVIIISIFFFQKKMKYKSLDIFEILDFLTNVKINQLRWGLLRSIKIFFFQFTNGEKFLSMIDKQDLFFS